MVDPESRAGDVPAGRTQLGRILQERPEARPFLSRAVASLIAATLAAFTAIGILLIWHLRRRARLLHERLSQPRRVVLPEPPERRSGSEPRSPVGTPAPGARGEGAARAGREGHPNEPTGNNPTA